MCNKANLFFIILAFFQSIQSSDNFFNDRTIPLPPDSFASLGLYDLPTISQKKSGPVNVYLGKKNDRNYLILDAKNFPTLQEGFELCGRSDLQNFLNENLIQYPTTIDQNNNEDSINNVIDIFNKVGNAIDRAQNFIMTTFLQDEESAKKIYNMLEHIIDYDLDLNSSSIYSYFHRTTPHHLTDKLFQYCTRVDFMKPVVKKYIECGDKYKPTQEELLRKTIRKQNAPMMQLLIHIKCYIPSESILDYAIKNHALKIIPMLGVDIKTKQDSLGLNQLHQAILNLNYELCQALIIAKIDINQGDTQGNTPLHYVAGQSIYYIKEKYGNFIYGENSDIKRRLITLLVQAGVNIHQKNNSDKSPLDLVKHREFYNALQSIDSQETSSSIYDFCPCFGRKNKQE